MSDGMPNPSGAFVVWAAAIGGPALQRRLRRALKRWGKQRRKLAA